jgi:TonB-linked SusC/RagA family outer membrane protein
LEVRSSFGYTNLQNNETLLNPLSSIRPDFRPLLNRTAVYSNNNMNSWIVEPQVNYKRSISRGLLDALVGATIQRNNNNGINLLGLGYNSDQVLMDIHSAATVTVGSSVASVYKYNALFGRLNFKWMDKYIINLSARRDGSSRFGSANQFHNFGSVGAAWIFSQENFARKALPFISFGKLRGSYGTTGNDQIGDYQFMSLYSPYTANVAVPYQGITAFAPTGLTNPYLQWEETKKLQFGLDLGLLKDRILLTGDYVYNRSSNQLIGTPLPVLSGFYSINANFPATVQNTGWEFTLNTQNIKSRDFTWSSSFNLTIPKNKLAAFPNLANSAYATTYVIGQPISIARAYHFAGVNDSTGVYQVTDSKGNITDSPDPSVDKTVIINTLPKFYGGFSNTFSYNGFQLDVFFQFVKQTGPNMLFGSSSFSGPGAVNTNEPVWVLSRWQKQGDKTNIQRFNSNLSLSGALSNALQSEAHWSDASYIRLKNVSLSYQLPQSWRRKILKQDCRIYVQGQNLLTITKYKGIDPETQSVNSLPPLRVVTAGLLITL